MTWDEYYDKFYDWAPSTQESKISQISSFGTSEQVWEIAQDFTDKKAANRLIKKAVINGVHFTAQEIEEMLYYIDDEVVKKAFSEVALPLTEEQIYTFQGIMDDAVLTQIATKSGVSLDEAEIPIDAPPAETAKERRKRHRKEFWDGAAETMMIDLFIDDWFGRKK
ncbi:MAG: hypothetical protein Q4F84_03640 [Fibrobacter sp.]|nr:hypothetical protein [Fibrobacter sp.]